MNRRTMWAVCALFLICAGLRLGLVRRQGLWADEYFSLAMATGHSLEHPAKDADPKLGDFVELQKPVSPKDYAKYLRHDSTAESPMRVIRAVFKSDTSPPLYYLLLYAWTRVLGAGDTSLRLFTVGFALACFPLLWWLGRQIGGTRTALAACILFTFSPTAIYYSTEGRMYSLVWFLSLVTMWLTLRMHRRGADLTTLATWIVFAAAGLMTHYFFAFVLAALGAWMILFPGRASRVRIIVGAIIVGILIAPWYMRIPQSLANWRVTADWLNLRPYDFNRFWGTLLLPWSFLTVRGAWGVRMAFDVINGIIFGATGLLMIGMLRRRAFSPRRTMLWFCIVGACAGLVLFDAWRKTYVIDSPRYALAGFPAALLLIGFGLAHLPKYPRWIFTAMIILVWLIGDRRIYVNESRQSPTRQVASVLNREAGPDDLVIVSSIPSGVTGIARYMKNETGFASWVSQLGDRTIPDDLIHLAAGRKRIILVRIHEVGAMPQHVDWLWRHSDFYKKLEIENATINFFRPLNSERFPAKTWPQNPAAL